MHTLAITDCSPARSSALLGSDDAVALATVFKALADPTRVRLLAYVAASSDGTVCACHLPEQLGITQPTLSHHLKKLVDAGLLTREQRGKWAHYAMTPAAVAPVSAYLASLNDKLPNLVGSHTKLGS